MSDQDWPEAPSAPTPEVSSAPDLPTIRDHAERLKLEKWQVGAVVARMHGEHDDKGVRVFANGVTDSTRISEKDFDVFLQLALHGRA